MPLMIGRINLIRLIIQAYIYKLLIIVIINQRREEILSIFQQAKDKWQQTHTLKLLQLTTTLLQELTTELYLMSKVP